MPDIKAVKSPSDSFRISKPGRKGMFVGVVTLVVLLVVLILRPFGSGAFFASVMYGIILVAVVVGARVFRAPGESLEPRPWWKATGNTILSFVLGGVAAWAFILVVFSAIYVESTDLEGYVVTRSLALFTAILGLFYLHSGVRQAIADERGRRWAGDPTTQSLLRPPFRLTTVGGKLAYVYLYLLVSFALLPFTSGAFWAIGLLIDLAFLVVGIRIFRGRDEAIVPPRARWRASGRPAASFVIAGLAAAITGFDLVSTFVGDPEMPVTPSETIQTVTYGTLVIALYLNSAIRLIRLKERPSIAG